MLLETQGDDGARAVATGLVTQSTGSYTSQRVLRLRAPADVDAGLAHALQVRTPGA